MYRPPKQSSDNLNLITTMFKKVQNLQNVFCKFHLNNFSYKPTIDFINLPLFVD